MEATTNKLTKDLEPWFEFNFAFGSIKFRKADRIFLPEKEKGDSKIKIRSEIRQIRSQRNRRPNPIGSNTSNDGSWMRRKEKIEKEQNLWESGALCPDVAV